MEKKTVLLVTILMVLLTSTIGCKTASPNAGHEAVLVMKPLIFGHGGVDPEPVKTGLSIIALTTDDVDVDMQPQRFDLDFPDTMTSDGVPLTFHAIMAIKVTDSVGLIRNFGPNWYKNNIEPEFNTRVRQAVRKHGMNETAINSTAIDAIDTEITSGIEAFIKAKNLPLNLVKITVGKANPPDAIKSQRIETAAQEQRSNTERQKKLAEDQRKMAEESRAKADNAYREAMQLSPTQFLQLETIKMQHEVCGKEGKGSCTFLIGSGGGVTPILDVKRK